MKYVVRKPYSYTDTKGRGKVYASGEIFEGELDKVQRFKVGRIDQAPELEVTTKTMLNPPTLDKAKVKAEPKVGEYYDPDDEGEET